MTVGFISLFRSLWLSSVLILGRGDDFVLCNITMVGVGFGGHAAVTTNSDNYRELQFDDDVSSHTVQTSLNCGRPAPAADTPTCTPHPCHDPETDDVADYMTSPAGYLSKICSQHEARARVPRVLVIGLGLGEFIIYAKKACPTGISIDAVEPSMAVIRLARMYGALSDPSTAALVNVNATTMDVAIGHAQARGNKYDLIFIDCFTGASGVPDGCRGVPLFRRVATLGPLVMQNVDVDEIGASSIKAEYEEALFENVSVSHVHGNTVLVATSPRANDTMLVSTRPSANGLSACWHSPRICNFATAVYSCVGVSALLALVVVVSFRKFRQRRRIGFEKLVPDDEQTEC